MSLFCQSGKSGQISVWEGNFRGRPGAVRVMVLTLHWIYAESLPQLNAVRCSFSSSITIFRQRRSPPQYGHHLPREYFFFKKINPTPENPTHDHTSKHLCTLLFPARSCYIALAEHCKAAAWLCCRSSTTRRRKPFQLMYLPFCKLGSGPLFSFIFDLNGYCPL